MMRLLRSNLFKMKIRSRVTREDGAKGIMPKASSSRLSYLIDVFTVWKYNDMCLEV